MGDDQVARALFTNIAKLAAIGGAAAVKDAEAKNESKGMKRGLSDVSFDGNATLEAEERARKLRHLHAHRERQRESAKKLKAADAAISEATALKIELDATKKALAAAEMRAEIAESELEAFKADLPDENEADGPDGGAGYTGDPAGKRAGDSEMKQAD